MASLARRIGIALMLAGLLGGCQQPGGAEGPQSAARVEGEGKLRFFEPEFTALLNQVVENLEQACTSSATDAGRLNGCLRDRFVAAFDDSREGRQNCGFHTEVSDFIGCVAIGNTLIDLRRRLADTSPLPATFWRKEDAMVEALSQSIVTRGIDNCGTAGGKTRLESCIIDWFERQVELPQTLSVRCDGQSEERDRLGCVIEGVMLRYLQDHVPRLGAMST
jgi:hypothetical protein